MQNVPPKVSGFIAIAWRVRIGDFYMAEGALGLERNASTWTRYAAAELVARAVGGVVERAPC